MLERELKLYVPPAAREALKAELRKAGASTITLRARYFDTQDKQLARAGMALRLRLEGDQWVQTIKAPGPDELTRLELNHPRAEPELDLSAYQNTALQSFFNDLSQPLLLRYETDIERLVLLHDGPNGTVEFAYDQGVIKSGQLELAVCELELEHVKGDAAYLFTLGRLWLESYQLMLDFRSKAERGSLLSRMAYPEKGANPSASQAEPLFPPHQAKDITLQADMSLQQAWQRYANECLNQIVRNAMQLASDASLKENASLQAAYAQPMQAGLRRLLSGHRLYSKRVQGCQAAPYADLWQYLAPQYQTAAQARALAASVPFQTGLLAVLEDLVLRD